MAACQPATIAVPHIISVFENQKHVLEMWASWRIKVCDSLWTAVVVGCERYSVVLRFKAIIVKYV